jgi:uncharacterized membrane protein YeaQ/YmgE (transglycosylase-associated protein family)
MNLIIWLIVGGVLGWLASIVIGIVGALLGGWLLSPLLGAGTINQSDFSLGGLLVSFLGAVVLLAVVNLVKRGSVR